MKVLVVFGTRPEAIKMAPVVKALALSQAICPVVCVTGQHREMLAGILDFFDIAADHDLAIMKPEQDLAYVTTAVLQGVQRVLAAEKPDWVLVHGDTTTTLAAALAAFYAGVRIGHVEAGLRTGDLKQPWPEEMNRSLVDRVADLLFAPTASARENLLKENAPPDQIEPGRAMAALGRDPHRTHEVVLVDEEEAGAPPPPVVHRHHDRRSQPRLRWDGRTKTSHT